jgi:hypothetical protein
MQNEPKFPRFSPKNKDCDEKRTQNEPKRTHFWPKNQGGKAKRTQSIRGSKIDAKHLYTKDYK